MSIPIYIRQAELLGQVEHGLAPVDSQHANLLPKWLTDPDFVGMFAKAIEAGKGKRFSESAMIKTINNFFEIA